MDENENDMYIEKGSRSGQSIRESKQEEALVMY